MNEFNEKVAVITGAGEGIGRAIAAEAARRGMKLVLADINPKTLHDLCSEFAAAGIETMGETLDVSDAQAVQTLADHAFERFGAVHLLVNNAGVALAKPVWETTESDWKWVTGVNLYGVTNSLRAFLPRMLEADADGHVVNVASIAGLLSEPGLAAYNATKFAVVTITEGLHHDLALRGSRIKVSLLCPGWVRTRIGEAERHREPAERSDPAKLDAHARKAGLAMLASVRAGISAEEVAQAMFGALERDEFYILTHERTRAGVEIRMNDILQNRPPTLLTL